MITRDKDKQAIAIREFLFGQLSHDESLLDLVNEILRKYARINDLKTKLSNEIDTLLNKKRSIDGADYNRDEDEVHVSFMTQSNEEKRPLTNKEKQFIRDVASAVESIVDLFAKMSDAELCERGIFNIKQEIVDEIKCEYFQTPEFRRSVETAVNEAIENSKKSQHGKKPCYEYAVQWIADKMKGFTVKPSETYERNEFAKRARAAVKRKSRELMDEIRDITDKGELKKLGFLVDESKAPSQSKETAASDGQSAAVDSHTSDTVSSGDREWVHIGTRV
ncbi:uncharacterized protein LOC141906965 isoform X2 [Tubulanus polymorphus]|uniref:uncharacterized protein LOC141906965 isoform X2 n=1 Tax=Tubulanus polymorphus TaxID=672921 RepID=UPI003DA43D0E